MPDFGRVVASAAERSPAPSSLMRAPAFAHLADQLGVPRPLEHDDGEVLDVDALGLGERLQVVGRRALDVDHAAPFGPDGDLVHVAVGTPEEDAGLGDGDDRERARTAGGGDAGAFERVERDLGR